jgi:hypothetical protein
VDTAITCTNLEDITVAGQDAAENPITGNW